MSDYTEGCCFNYFRDNCSGRGCICKCHEEEAERLRQRSRDEDTARIRLNDARIKAEAERDALAAQVAALREALEAMTLSSDRLLVERDQYMDRLGRLLPTLTPEQMAIERAALAEAGGDS
mgnify:CR=1 FL=1